MKPIYSFLVSVSLILSFQGMSMSKDSSRVTFCFDQLTCSDFLDPNVTPKIYIIDSILMDTVQTVYLLPDSLCYNILLKNEKSFYIKNNFNIPIPRKVRIERNRDHIVELRNYPSTNFGHIFRFDLDSTFSKFTFNEEKRLTYLINTVNCYQLKRIVIGLWGGNTTTSNIQRIGELFKMKLIEKEPSIKNKIELSFAPSDLVVDFGENVIVKFYLPE